MARLRKVSPKAMRDTGSALRFVVTFFALLAFSLQSYVTQTHIHLAPDRFASYGAEKSESQKRLPDRFPANGDPSNCPICQEVLHSGQFITPAAAALLPPSLVASIVPVAAQIAVVARAASHAWRSRAPPKA